MGETSRNSSAMKLCKSLHSQLKTQSNYLSVVLYVLLFSHVLPHVISQCCDIQKKGFDNSLCLKKIELICF